MKFSFLFIVLLFLTISSSCKKEQVHHPCYDRTLVTNSPCPTDCPGFIGCDGNTYCNECIAAKQGIGS